MKRVLSLIVAMGVAALFSSAALAGANCDYHKTQASVTKTETSKEVATVAEPDKPATTDQMQTAQANPTAKAASTTKK